MGWMINATFLSLYCWERDPLPTVQEARRASRPVWTDAEKLAPPGFDPWTVQPVENHYTEDAIPAHMCICWYIHKRS